MPEVEQPRVLYRMPTDRPGAGSLDERVRDSARSPGCFHTDKPTISVVGHGATKATRTRLGRNPKIAEKRAAMGIDWMNRDELSEAIPPVYTELVGNYLLGHIRNYWEDAA